jgi:hypothetical protein
MPRPLLLAALLLAPLALAACARPESEETKAATSRADPKLEPGTAPDPPGRETPAAK